MQSKERKIKKLSKTVESSRQGKISFANLPRRVCKY